MLTAFVLVTAHCLREIAFLGPGVPDVNVIVILIGFELCMN